MSRAVKSIIDRSEGVRCGQLTFELLLICSLAFLATFPVLNRPFASHGEPREALVVERMVETGEIILPRGFAGVVPSKPPMIHWLAAGTTHILGISEASLRLPVLLLSIIFIGYFFWFVAVRFDSKTALLAALILFTAPEWIRSSLTLRVDIPLSVFFALSLLLFLRWYERGLSHLPCLVIFSLTAATLAKGPVACVLFAGIVGVFLRVRNLNWGPIIKVLSQVLIPTICFASIWYFAAWYRGGEEFLAKVWSENFQRMASTMEDSPHEHSPFYLIGVLIVGALPWSLVWLTVEGSKILKTLRTSFARAALHKQLQSFYSTDALVQLSFITLAIILTFFMIPSSKRGVYLLPAYPALALLLALWLRRVTVPAVLYKMVRYTGNGLLLGSAVLFIAVGLYPFPSDVNPVSVDTVVSLPYAAMLQNLILSWRSGFLFGLLAVVWGVWRVSSGSPERLLRVQLAIIALMTTIYVPAYSALTTPRQFARDLEGHLETTRLCAFNTRPFGFDFYSSYEFTRCDKFQNNDQILVPTTSLPKLEQYLEGNWQISKIAESKSDIEELDRKMMVVQLTQPPRE